MDRIKSDITDDYVSRLPEGRQFYRMDDLRAAGMPSFLVRRLELQLRRNLRESLKPFRSEWTDLQAEEVERRWEAFLKAAETELRLPSSHARRVVEDAVSGCLELLVEPRKRISEVLFGSDTELPREELDRRLEWVVVYRQFHSLIPRYMEKKGLDTLTRKRCEIIIANADRKLSDRYDTGDWVRLLEPLYEMLGGKVPPDLLTRFFSDKELTGLAGQFEEIGVEEVDRETLEELLSGAGKTDADAPDTANENEAPWDVRESEPPASNINTLFSEGGEEEPNEPVVPENKQEAEEPEEEEEAESTPMWMRYLDPDEQRRLEEREEEQEENLFPLEEETDTGEPEPAEEPEFEEEPLIDLTEPSGNDENGQGGQELQSLLNDDRDYFVEEIFRGSDRAYEEALEEISACEDWRSASRYIEQNIFKRNLVDMYSEPAVDFTDRLQSWFTEQSKSQ